MNKNKKRAITYAGSSVFMNMFFVPVVMLIMGFSENIIAAISVTSIVMYFTYLLNYKKYKLMCEKAKVSFIRIVIFDVSLLFLPYLWSMMRIKYGYIELTPALVFGIVMIPMLITNKKISKLYQVKR